MGDARGSGPREIKTDGELNTWNEIAAYLGQSVRGVQRWEKQLGLPVRRLPGEKARVFAYAAELDAWKGQNAAIASGAGGGAVVAEHSAKLVAAEVQGPETRPECVEDPSPAPVERRRPLVRRLAERRFWTAAGLLLILLPVGYFSIWNGRPQPSDLRVSGRDLIALNRQGSELWRYSFAVALWEAFYSEQQSRLRFSWIGQLQPGRGTDVVFVAKTVKAKELGDTLYCFDGKGRLRWQFTPGRAVTDRGGTELLPPYLIAGLEVLTSKSPGETRIAVSSNHHLEQPDQVAFLDSDGRVTGEYWHPGHLLQLAQADLDGDGRNELILGGVNNASHQATLVVLDPLGTLGVSTEAGSPESRFELLNMAAAKEKAVVLFPRSCIALHQPYTRVRDVRVTSDRVIAEVAEGTTEVTPGFVYELEYGLLPTKVTPDSVSVGELHRELEKRGDLDHPFAPEAETSRLKAGVVVRRR